MVTPKALVRPLLLSAAAVAVVDQSTKTIVRAAMELCPNDPVDVCERIALIGPLGLLRSHNDASAFGFSGGGSLLPLLLAAILLLATQLRMARPTRLVAIGIGLQLGGLVANLVDRIAFGAVTDFIHLQVGNGYRGPVANPADIALVLGGILATVAILRSSPSRWRT